MNIIFLGAPGAGKGTQSSYLSQHYDLTLISTGDMLRQAVSHQTPIGVQAYEYMNQGKLVPDSIIIAMLKERISKKDCRDGFILDGFPRTLPQAQDLAEMLKEAHTHIDLVIYLSVDEEALVDRITGRFTCSHCGRTYHQTMNPPKKHGECDSCGHHEFSKRDDDKRETVLARLKEYHKMTMPILPFYEKQGLLVSINGMQSPDRVRSDIVRVMSKVPMQKG